VSDTPLEINRTVAIEHEGKLISVEVHIHLSQEEIERIVVPATMKGIANYLRAHGGSVIRENPFYREVPNTGI